MLLTVLSKKAIDKQNNDTKTIALNQSFSFIDLESLYAGIKEQKEHV